MVFKVLVLSRPVFVRSIKVLGWQPGAPKSPGAGFSKRKKRPTFEIHRTGDASMGSVALSNLAYGLSQKHTSQSNVCKVN